jgi:hypothetical protein
MEVALSNQGALPVKARSHFHVMSGNCTDLVLPIQSTGVNKATAKSVPAFLNKLFRSVTLFAGVGFGACWTCDRTSGLWEDLRRVSWLELLLLVWRLKLVLELN